MNWYKAKTILIIFLLAVNLALLSYISIDSFNSMQIEAQATNSAIKLLNQKNIYLDKKILSSVSGKKSMKNVYVNNVISDYAEFSKKILGNNIDSDNNTYNNKKGTISFQGDFFEAHANTGDALQSFSVSEAKAVKLASDYLTSLGFNIDTSDTQFENEKDMFIVTFKQAVNGFYLFASEITVEMSPSGVISIYGRWYNELSKNLQKSELKSVTGILIEYMNNYTEFNTQRRISDIRLGYYTPDSDTFHESVVMTPVCRITDYEGNITYIDARENV